MIDYKLLFAIGQHEDRKAHLVELLKSAGAQFEQQGHETHDFVEHFGDSEPRVYFRDELIGKHEQFLSHMFGKDSGKFTKEFIKVKMLNPRATVPSAGSTLAVGLDLSACLPELTDENYIEYSAAMRSMGLTIHWHPGITSMTSSQVSYFALAPGGKAAIPIGIAVEIPRNHYLRIAPRSGLAVKNGIATMAGVVDADFRGELKVVLVNHGERPFEIKHGDRIAQGILEKAAHPAVFVVPKLSETMRGESGWGSTGVSAERNPNHDPATGKYTQAPVEPIAEPTTAYEAKALAAAAAD